MALPFFMLPLHIGVQAFWEKLATTAISLLFSDHRECFPYEFHLLHRMRYSHNLQFLKHPLTQDLVKSCLKKKGIGLRGRVDFCLFEARTHHPGFSFCGGFGGLPAENLSEDLNLFI